MYHSLVNTEEEFTLYVFAFDDLAAEILRALKPAHMRVVTLKEFETKRLLEIKKTRTKVEYCWTCTSFIIGHALDAYALEEITYLDADLYFFAPPRLLLEEFHAADCDVLLTEHRYTPRYDQSHVSGKYCVQFMTFRNNANGRRILTWWQDRCAEWCYYKIEDGKLGDQKYLDDWTERFSGVHVLQNIGGGAAPWNIQQYQCAPGPCIDGTRLIFYHFHGLVWQRMNLFNWGVYDIDETVARLIYEPYTQELKRALNMVRKRYRRNFRRGFSIDVKTLENYLYTRLRRRSGGFDMNALLSDTLSGKEAFVIFGAGDVGQEAARWLEDGGAPIRYFADNDVNKQSCFCGKIPIERPGRIAADRGRIIVVLATYQYQNEVKSQLENMGLKHRADYVYFREIKEKIIAAYVGERMKWAKNAPKFEGVIKWYID